MEIKLDRRNATPIHLQIAHQLRERILKGAIPPEGKLPPSRKLAADLGVNRSTLAGWLSGYSPMPDDAVLKVHRMICSRLTRLRAEPNSPKVSDE